MCPYLDADPFPLISGSLPVGTSQAVKRWIGFRRSIACRFPVIKESVKNPGALLESCWKVFACRLSPAIIPYHGAK